MSEYLQFDKKLFQSHYPEKTFAVKHNLVGNPLLGIPSLVELSKILPEIQIEFYTGKVGVNEDKTKTPPTGLTATETIAKIESAESWLVLKRVEWDPKYRELVHGCLEPFEGLIQSKTPQMEDYRGWVFVTSPQSISPYHVDPEHNLLLQIQGTKTIHVFDQNDRDLLSSEELERFYQLGTKYPKLEWKEEFMEKARTFVMKPGDGVFIPVAAPHWVKVEDEVSVSISLTWYTPEIGRRARTFKLNSMLRKMGINPTDYGRSPKVDAAKWALISSILKTKKALGLDKEPNVANH